MFLFPFDVQTKRKVFSFRCFVVRICYKTFYFFLHELKAKPTKPIETEFVPLKDKTQCFWRRKWNCTFGKIKKTVIRKITVEIISKAIEKNSLVEPTALEMNILLFF